MRFDVITFGSAVVDVFVKTNLPEKAGKISYPSGSKIKITETRTDIGGGGTNTAVAFSRLGMKTGCISKIGDDANGKKILNCLKKEKIKFLGAIEKNSSTDFSIILDSRESERTILVHKKINNELSLKEVNFRKLKTKWIYLSTVLGKSFQTQKKIAKTLHERGVKIAFNPTEYLIKEEDIFPLLKICDVMTLNKEEAMLLTKKKDLLKGLHELGPKIVVITDKDNLISCFDGKKKYFLKPNKVKVVERTGAGDAFASGFVAGIIVNKSIQECLKLGLREGESVLGYLGAKNNLIRRNLKKK